MAGSSILERFMDLLLSYGPKVIGAIIVLLVGLWAIKLATKAIKRKMEKRDSNKELRGFLVSMSSIALKVLLFISVFGMVGIQVTSFIAILGAAGLAVGMALQGSLQNFAGGVIIILLKPFKVGDVLEAEGYTGVVKDIQIFSTILTTFDNKTIIIPNGGLATSAMVNYNPEPNRRVDWNFRISYGANYDKAKEILNNMIAEDDRILKDPEHFIAISGLKEGFVEIVVRTWVKAEDYWGVYFSLNEKVYKTFANEGLSNPIPQMNINLNK